MVTKKGIIYANKMCKYVYLNVVKIRILVCRGVESLSGQCVVWDTVYCDRFIKTKFEIVETSFLFFRSTPHPHEGVNILINIFICNIVEHKSKPARRRQMSSSTLV